ncbi:glycerate kinase [Verrucomicrobium sp. BvORR034]|jgi:glycerate kinase|uniref:glycerate kinase n=1 Tax=Verrucomicrobium sp. BvORR034 TaxID=1396418 RepID=UPI000679A9AB|nr:glycerate kinase [Verrucomicrobium sp. BvORR034]
MRILLALDKFKGSLSAREASDAVRRGLAAAGVEAEICACPIADGGEGFTEAIMTCVGGQWHEAPVHDARGRDRIARYGIIDRKGHTEAVMEMSAASGLAIVNDLPLDPAVATTRGTGELMLHALEQGVKRILIGIGGSATNDGGTGMASALGVRFLDSDEVTVEDLPAEIEKVRRIAKTHRLPVDVVVACDVTNPLLGEHGCTHVYGPQKGVKDLAFFEQRMTRLADMVRRDLGCDHQNEPGAGAAGGLGFGLMSFCGARLQSGFDLVAEVTGLREHIMEADLVITGEGKLDAQTLHGKGPLGVADMAREVGKRVIGVGGIIDDSPELRRRFDGLVQVKPPEVPIPEAIRRASELLEQAITKWASHYEFMAPV